MSRLGPLRVILTVHRGSDVLTKSRDASGVVGPGSLLVQEDIPQPKTV